MKKEHELKVWPPYFDDVETGKKPFELRKLDRLFGVGDILYLREWSPAKGYSGRETRKEITYLLAGGQFGLPEDYCIMGLSAPPSAALPVRGKEDVWEWVAIFYGALKELVDLKMLKETLYKGNPDGKEYTERKPKAWHLAKEAIELWKKSDYGALPLPTPAVAAESKEEIEWSRKHNEITSLREATRREREAGDGPDEFS